MQLNEKSHGFTVTRTKHLPELEGTLVEMKHDRTGLELVWIDRSEENMTFAIAFATYPENDTGVFHILEHSVLCGSDKYPMKEPFVELMKTSMNTFLNAITFPDKTCYPVSSRNRKDFMNLTRVYLDAVFHPLIYSKPEIFYQEGWHYAFDKDGNVSYNGVVDSEMKGALADPDELSESALLAALFPDSPYRWNCGGDPAKIPDLSYEEFLNNHRRFYSPSNAYVFLDGALDIDEMLATLEEYLDGLQTGERIAPPEIQKPVDGGTTELEYEVSAEEDTAKKSRAVWGFVTGTHEDIEKTVALHVLCDVLCGNNHAPLCRKVLEKGLAESVSMNVADGMLQNYLRISAKNLAYEDIPELKSVIFGEIERLVKEGLSHEDITATMALFEFRMRERDYGKMPQGLVLGIQALSHWLYGGDPSEELEVGDLFVKLREKLESGWFENLLSKTVLENNHKCEIILKPSPDAGNVRRDTERKRLEKESAAWSQEEREMLINREKRLVEMQSREDTPEVLATLPKLTLADVSPEPEQFPTEIIKTDGVTVLRHDIPTSGIVYCTFYFDAMQFTEQELPALSFLTGILGKLRTKKHSAKELASKIRLLFGTLSFSVQSYGRVTGGGYDVKLRVVMSSLEKNLSEALALIIEILTETEFDEEKSVRELLRQEKLEMFDGIVMEGQSIGMARVLAEASPAGVVIECTSGLTYYRWLSRTESDWNWDKTRNELMDLSKCAVNKHNFAVSITGADDVLSSAIASRIAQLLPEGERRQNAELTPRKVCREGIVIPSDMAFAVSGGDMRQYGGKYSGKLLLASHIATLTYLWNSVRVQGGAYGTGLRIGLTGNAVCTSYRDPNAARSLDVYKGVGEFLRGFCESGMELDGFIIGTLAATEPLLTPRLKGAKGDEYYWIGLTYEDRRKTRHELLSSTPESLQEVIDPLEKAIVDGGVCVFGSKEQLDKCGKFDSIETL